jgi:hypothetical protein
MQGKKFEETVEIVKGYLEEFSKSQEEKNQDPNQWLRTIYEHHSELFLANNNKIWTTASVLIPLSLAGFVAIASLDDLDLYHVQVLMFASISLILIWLVIAENHRAFQQKDEAWLVAIERIIKIEDKTGSKVQSNFFNRLLTYKAAVQISYWILFVGILIVWTYVYWLTYKGIL